MTTEKIGCIVPNYQFPLKYIIRTMTASISPKIARGQPIALAPFITTPIITNKRISPIKIIKPFPLVDDLLLIVFSFCKDIK